MEAIKYTEIIKGGVIVASKPANITSHDVIDYFRNLSNERQIGHAGTLDPFATGEIILLIGKYTSFSNLFTSLKKTYRFSAILGAKTLSGDLDEKVIKQNADLNISENNKFEILSDLENGLKALEKEYYQTVPVLSSIKVSGEKLRKLVRRSDSVKVIDREEFEEILKTNPSVKLDIQTSDSLLNGIDRKIAMFSRANNYKYVLLPQRKVNIYSHKELKLEGNILSGEVTVSSGTYIRKLIEDLTESSINTYSYLKTLDRFYDSKVLLSTIDQIKTD